EALLYGKRTLQEKDSGQPYNVILSWLCCVQRQAVLQLSLQKLCCFPPHAETALVRRVLIANTLRLLRDELGQQGALPEAPGLSEAVEGSRREEPLSQGEGSLTPAWVLEQDGEDLFSAVTAMGGLCPAACLPSCSSSSVPQHEPQHTGSRIDVPAAETSQKESQVHTGTTGPTLCEPHMDSSHHTHFCSPTPLSVVPSPSSSSFLPDLSLDDFLVSDLDNFLCEFNACGSNLSPTPSSTPKLFPMGTDDIMEHIMEVLVGS
uniref:SERTA domain-containing protein n=1 Tax=Electrophorus electricus TaxID=8005 RepID=A0AAY5EF01_ELEEL